MPQGIRIKSTNSMITMRTQMDNYEVRIEFSDGKEFLVIPVTMMVEGVHHGSRGPLLHTIDELGRIPASWDGRPIVINHPQENEVFVSANQPSILESTQVGTVYNTHVENDKLQAEAWIDPRKLQAVSPDSYTKILNRQKIEVSVGVFSDEEDVQGNWRGEDYTAIAHNHRPDHLALLPNGVGACSIEDGCGLGANRGGKMEIEINALSYFGTETTAWSAPSLADFSPSSARWEDLPAAERSKIANHFLIGSGGIASFAELKLPVVNPRTGKLNERALRAVIGGRGAAVGGVSANVRASARRKAYNLLNKEFKAELTIPQGLEAMEEKWDGVESIIAANTRAGYRTMVENAQRILDGMDVHRENGESKYHFLEDMYDGYIIYRQRNGEEVKYFRQNYQMEGDNVQFSGNPTEVSRKVEFVPVSANEDKTKKNNKKEKELNTMSEKKKPCTPCEMVDAIINSNQNNFTEEDRPVLTAMEEGTLKKMMPVETKSPVVNEKDRKETVAPTREQILNALSEEDRESLNFGHKMRAERRAKMVKVIQDNAGKELWPDETLNAMNEDMLEKVSKSVLTRVKKEQEMQVDFSFGGMRTNDSLMQADEEGDELLLPTGFEFETDKK